MVNWSEPKRTKVVLTVYVPPKVKRGMKILGGMLNQTTSKIVEDLCIEYLRRHPKVGEILEGEE